LGILSYNNRINSIITKNILTVTKPVPQTGRYRAYPLTVSGSCLHRGLDGRPKPAQACFCRVGLVPGHGSTADPAHLDMYKRVVTVPGLSSHTVGPSPDRLSGRFDPGTILVGPGRTRAGSRAHCWTGPFVHVYLKGEGEILR
jgi:hypothetical protein